MIKLIKAINGNIRNTKRLPQLHNVCSILNILIIEPKKLTIDNSWFIGFFDAKGDIYYYPSYSLNNINNNNKPELIISVKNKRLVDIKMFKDIFEGNIYFDKSNNGYYKWIINDKLTILNFINKYIKYNPSRTTKINKLSLCNKFYSLIDLNFNNPFFLKIWLHFESKFNSYKE